MFILIDMLLAINKFHFIFLFFLKGCKSTLFFEKKQGVIGKTEKSVL